MSDHDPWELLEDLNIPLFYYDYTDSIKVEQLYQAFKERLKLELSLEPREQSHE